jgi:polysaccharide deacetylase 2 family uncharacterized protein YibQ
MKYICLILAFLSLCAVPAWAGNSAGADTVESRMAGTNPDSDAPAPAKPPEAAEAQPVPAAAEPAIVWSQPEPALIPDTPLPASVTKPTTPAPGILSSDSGDYQYEALPPVAEKPPVTETVAAAPLDGKRRIIAIVIDDMGVDRRHSARAIKLPPAVTLSYLPYSTQIIEQTDAAKQDGHELLVHMPMQPDRASADPGPDFLGTDMAPTELHDRVEKSLAAFTGYVGINNHMGSKFTCDRAGLDVVMTMLEERKLMFLDSRTSPASVAEDVARAHHLQTTHRDVFIDDDESPAAVAKQLRRIETVAKHGGSAIAIGHPKDVTLSALEAWLPTLKEKGFDLVPLSEVIELRDGGKSAVAVAATPAVVAPVAAAVETPAPLPATPEAEPKKLQ